jgi:SAM-dependent methyltransferase
MSVEERERIFFDRHYGEQGWNPTGFELRLRRELSALLRLTRGRKIGRVLSVGCGEGPFECLLAPHADSVLGIDLSGEAIDKARARACALGLGNVDFRCENASQLRVDERFDGIVCIAFLHHVPEAELPGLLAGFHALLRPGGYFFARDPSKAGVLRAVGRSVLGARYDHYHSPDELELDAEAVAGQLRAAGFASVEIGWIDLALIPGHYLLPRAPRWLMHAFAGLDRVFCATPLARWGSSFTAFATRSG